MKTLIAIRELVYDAKKRNPGDQFNATDLDAVILSAHDISGGPQARLVEEDRFEPLQSMPMAEAAPPTPEPVHISEPAPELVSEEPVVEESIAPSSAMDTDNTFALVPPRRRFKRRDQ